MTDSINRGFRSLTGWMWTWVAVGLAVVLVVAGFLVAIVSSLEAIDGNLTEAGAAVKGADGDVTTLPGSIAEVNEALAGIDAAVRPLSSISDDVSRHLGDIGLALKDLTGSLGGVTKTLGGTAHQLATLPGAIGATQAPLDGTAAALAGTTSRLGEIAGSLSATSDTLGRLHDLALAVDGVLEDSEQPPDDLGAHDIFERGRAANSSIALARAQVEEILTRIRAVNASLRSVCSSNLLRTPAGEPC